MNRSAPATFGTEAAPTRLVDRQRSPSLSAKGSREKTARIAVVKIGRDGEIRTRDPLNPIQVRYQAALRPVPWRVDLFGGTKVPPYACPARERVVRYDAALRRFVVVLRDVSAGAAPSSATDAGVGVVASLLLPRG